jgi:hypothetical protein
MLIRGSKEGDVIFHFRKYEKELYKDLSAPDYKETAAPMDPKSVHDRMKRTEKKMNKKR